MTIQEQITKLKELLAAATPGEWFAWFRAPKFEGDAGSVDISIKTEDDDWCIAEFYPFGRHANDENYANADKERMLAIECRNAMPALLDYIEKLEKKLNDRPK